MTRHSALVRSDFGVSGVVVLLLLLAGFFAMHGVASTSATGVHHSGVTLAAVGDVHTTQPRQPSDAMASTDGSGTHGSREGGVSQAGEGAEDDGSGATHEVMVGCLLVLCGFGGAVVLRRSRGLRAAAGDGALRSAAGRVPPRPGRPPPRRRHLSLCVLRV